MELVDRINEKIRPVHLKNQTFPGWKVKLCIKKINNRKKKKAKK